MEAELPARRLFTHIVESCDVLMFGEEFRRRFALQHASSGGGRRGGTAGHGSRAANALALD